MCSTGSSRFPNCYVWIGPRQHFGHLGNMFKSNEDQENDVRFRLTFANPFGFVIYLRSMVPQQKIRWLMWMPEKSKFEQISKSKFRNRPFFDNFAPKCDSAGSSQLNGIFSHLPGLLSQYLLFFSLPLSFLLPFPYPTFTDNCQTDM